MSTALPPTVSAAEWNHLRAAFSASLLAETPLASLAENLDGPAWPIRAREETPAAYLDLPADEVVALLALKGQPPERFAHLVTILRETLAFDDPFGAMVSHSEAAVDRENPVRVNLAKLAIPAEFPLSLAALAPDTIAFCQLEGITTLGEFALLAQRLSQNVVVGGDFRALLNALSHVDELTLARYLPFRPGARGLHLIEAVAQALRAFPTVPRDTLLAGRASAFPPELRARLEQIFTFFADQRAELGRQIAAGTSLGRSVMVLNEPGLERFVTAVLSTHLPTATATPRSRSWLSRIFRR